MASSSESIITDQDLILVTGASGYIACHIVKQLLELGYRVRGTVRSVKDEKKCAPLKRLVSNPKHEIELCEADLLNEQSWLEAVKGCTYVIHTASPFPNSKPDDENVIIQPAVNGTLFVLRACLQEGSKVKRVVLTSSVAAIAGDHFRHGFTYTEKDWPETKDQQPYTKSKIMAEQAAWNFMKEKNPSFELTTINPGFVMGPLLHDVPCTSMEAVKKLMLKEMPFLPNLYMPACDVRDVAKAHVKALTCTECVSERHIIVSTVESTCFKDWALILDKEFKSKNYSIPTMVSPNFLVKVFSIFDSSIKMITEMLGVKSNFDNSRMINVLKIEPTNMKDTVVDMAYSMIEKGILPKKY